MMMLPFTLALLYVAMAAVSLSMERHQEQIAGRTLAVQPTKLWRSGGWLLLALALVPAISAWGTSVGIAAWLGLMTFASLALGLQLTYAPQSVRFSALSACVLLPLFLIAGWMA